MNPFNKPLFTYFGGKQRMASKIVPLLPPHTCYVEPFAGSAAVMFKKGLPVVTNNDHYREVLNDTNAAIVNIFKVMQDPILRDKLLQKLCWTVFAESEYEFAKRINDNPTQYPPELQAWSTLLGLQMSFAGKLFGGMKFATSSENHAGGFNNWTKNLQQCKDRLRLAYIFNTDALTIIKRFDAPHTCFYVDPPYPETTQGHYRGYTQQDFDNLIEVLNGCKGSVVLSCYDNTAVPDSWEKHSFDAVASSKGITGDMRNTLEKPTRNAKRTECVWVKPSTRMRDNLWQIALRNKETMGKGE